MAYETPVTIDYSKWTKAAPIGVNVGKGSSPQVAAPSSVNPIRKGAGMLIRGASGLGPGGLIGAGMGAGGEALAEMVEGSKLNPATIAAMGGINAIPMGGTLKLLPAMLKGAGVSALGTGLIQQTEGGAHIPTKEELESIGISGGIGAVGGGIGHGIGKLLSREASATARIADNLKEEAPKVELKSEAAPVLKVSRTSKAKTPPVKVPEGVDPVTGEILETATAPPTITGPEFKNPPKKAKGSKTTKGVPPSNPIYDAIASASSLAASSKPRYRIGAKEFIPEFDNPVDKTLFILAQDKPSKLDDQLITAISDKTDISVPALRAEAKKVKAALGKFLKTADEGPVKIPKLHALDEVPASSLGKKSAQRMAAEANDSPERKFYRTRSGEVTEVNDFPEPAMAHDIDTADQLLSNRPPQINIDGPQTPKPSGVRGWIQQVLREGRQAQTTGDLSFPFRQGITNIHRPEFWKSFGPMMQSALKEGNYQNLMKDIEAHPYYKYAKGSGLDFEELGSEMSKRPEQMRGTFLEKYVPGVRASNRAYSAFGNKLRMDMFSSMIDKLEGAGIPIDHEAQQAVAKYINDSTGRGNLGSWEKSADKLNEFIFSPKLIASRVNMFRRAFSPLFNASVDPKISRQLRVEALKSMANVGMLALTSGGISSLLLNKPEAADPFNTDFGKLKVGNTRLDFTGGFQQYVRTAAQLARELYNTSTGNPTHRGDDIAIRFGRNKLSPAASLIFDAIAGENTIGDKFNLKSEIGSRAFPIIYQDLLDVYNQHPEMLPAAIPAATLGVGVQTYGENSGNTSGPTVSIPTSGRGLSRGFSRGGFKR